MKRILVCSILTIGMVLTTSMIMSDSDLQAKSVCCGPLFGQVRSINETTAIIQGKVCSIQRTVNAIKGEGCDFLIKQADIPKTITKPGVYCLAEDVKASGNCIIMIDIQTDCVVLDLKDHTVDGNGVADTGISAGVADPEISNIIIRNGFVKGATGDGVSLLNVIDGVVERVSSSENGANGFELPVPSIDTLNIIFRECQASFNGEDGFRFRATVDNCCLLSCKSNFNNPGGGASSRGFGFCLEGQRHVVRDCVANDNELEGFQLFGTLPPVNSTFFGYHVVADCSSVGSRTAHGFDIKNLTSNAIRNCVAINNFLDGFKVGGGNNTVRDCTAIENGSEGFRLANEGLADRDENNVLRGCNAVKNGKIGFCIESKNNMIRDCVANENAEEGFELLGKLGSPPSSPIFGNNVVRDCSASKNGFHGFDAKFSSQNEFRDCVAIDNDLNGFKLAGKGNTVRGCTATGNTSEGFQIAVAGGSFKDDDNVIRDCTAANNGGEGFDVDSPRNLIRDCMAVGNSTEGFRIDAGDNRVLSCMANDNGADYFGVAPGLIVSTDVTIAAANNQWINVED